MGRLFSLGSFLKITEGVVFLLYLLARKKLCIIFDKKRLGLHFGRFFTKHPVTLKAT
jgi:hypothetical protein